MKDGAFKNRARRGRRRSVLLVTAVLIAASAFPASAYAQITDRKVVFECPCSAVFTPDGDGGGGGTLTLHFGLRNHRDVRSAGLVVRVGRRDEDGFIGWFGPANIGDILPQSPLWEQGVPAAQVIRGLSHSVRVGQPRMGGTLAVELAEADGDLSSSDPNAHVYEVASSHEVLTLWPVPGGETDATTRFVDILTDSDSDRVGDVNERIAGTRPDNPDSTPGTSEVDMLWLYQKSLASPDHVPEYHHAAVVANAMFVDSGTNLRLRSVGFAPVDDGDIDEHGDIKEEPLEELLDRHGADLFNFWFNNQDGIEDPCPEAAIGCAGLGDSRQRGRWSPAHSYTTGPGGGPIAHELGHVMGLVHAAREGESWGSFRWSRGHTSGGPPPHYATIMGTVGYGTSPSVFSSPTSGRCWPLDACGLPATHHRGADAVRSLDLVRFQVADVRQGKPDSDGDGFVDAADAFPNDPGDWADLDGDGIGDNVDPDADGDGRANADDAFPHDADEWADLDGDGLGDNADPDRDGDGVDNGGDLFPDDALDHADADGDGVGDNAEALHPFRDANLRAVVERALGKAEGDPISDAEMAGLEVLERRDAAVEDLTGLELATGLARLRLGVDARGYRNGVSGGGVRDLTPLADLEALEMVGLAMSPRLSDLSPLASLRNLTSLKLAGDYDSHSEVSDLRALTSLPLTELWISRASVSDASPLSGLSQLRSLNLWENEVSDISPLAGLSKLTELDLKANRISDISPLAGLQKLESISIRNNLIVDVFPLAELPLLRSLVLSYNEIEDVSVLGGLTGLSYLHLDGNRVADASALTALTGLHELAIGANRLSVNDFLEDFEPGPNFYYLDLAESYIDDLSPLADFMERSGARWWNLGLSENPLTDLSPLVRPALWHGGGHISLWGVRLRHETAEAQIAELESMGVTVSNDYHGIEVVDIPDGHLRDLFQEAAKTWKLVDDPVTRDSAARIRRFRAFGQGITDLTGLEAATGLEHLHLASNAVADLSPILSLEALDYVDLDGNPLSEAALNEQVPDLLAKGVEVQLARVAWHLPPSRQTATFDTLDYFAARLGVPPSSGITFTAASGNAFLSPSVSDGGTVALPPRRIGGPADVVVEAQAGGQSATLAFSVIAPKEVPLFLGASEDAGREGFLRVVNHSNRGGDVRIEAVDDAGGRAEAVYLSLNPRQAVHLNSRDLEGGNARKGLPSGIGNGEGAWRLTLSSVLNPEALSNVRTQDGFVTSMNAAAPKADDGALRVGFLNPGSNYRQESRLRIVNPGADAATVRITGTDDAGAPSEGAVTVDVPAGHALTFTAAELESGQAPGLSGALGEGQGKWRLFVESDAEITAMSLLETPTGHLANLSALPPAPDADGIRTVPLFLSASDPLGRQGFMRVVNRSGLSGTVRIRAFDGSDFAYDPVNLSLGPRQARHFNAEDLEAGNAAKGLSGSTGAGRGNWRLELDSDLDFETSAHIRTADGFVTSVQAVAPELNDGLTHRIAFLNPGSNYRQASRLLLVNRGAADAEATVTGIDDAGLSQGGPVRVRVPAGGSVSLSAKALEDGGAGFEGALGDGSGKWRLCLTADAPIVVMSLLETPTGHLTNMSASTDLFDCAEAD